MAFQNPGGPDLGAILQALGSAANGGGLGASYGAPPQLQPGDQPQLGGNSPFPGGMNPGGPMLPAVSQSNHETLTKLQQLGGILKQLGHPAFQGTHLPGLPPGVHVPHHPMHQTKAHPGLQF